MRTLHLGGISNIVVHVFPGENFRSKRFKERKRILRPIAFDVIQLYFIGSFSNLLHIFLCCILFLTFSTISLHCSQCFQRIRSCILDGQYCQRRSNKLTNDEHNLKSILYVIMDAEYAEYRVFTKL